VSIPLLIVLRGFRVSTRWIVELRGYIRRLEKSFQGLVSLHNKPPITRTSTSMFTSSISRRSTGSSVPCSELPCRLCPCSFQAFLMRTEDFFFFSLGFFGFLSFPPVSLAFFFLQVALLSYTNYAGLLFVPFSTLVYNVSPGAAMLSPCCPSHQNMPEAVWADVDAR
jgi:hypothetical protein